MEFKRHSRCAYSNYGLLLETLCRCGQLVPVAHETCVPLSGFHKGQRGLQEEMDSIYNDYKEHKAMNMRSGSERSEKCRWYQLVDEFISDRAHVISHAHANAMNPDGPKSASASFTNTTEHKSGESTSKSPEPKRKDDVFLERCLGRIEESSKNLMDSLKASDDMKMALLMSMQQTMQKLVEKI